MINTIATTVDPRPGASRFRTRLGWLDSHHSFSFANHYDPANVGHGLLIVSNDDVVAPGAGFGSHPHRDMEIVTWVLEGRLEHRDSAGNHGILEPGIVQRMSAGTGIVHSEVNHSATEPVHFLQMWVPPDGKGRPPAYEQRDVSDALAGHQLIPVASGTRHAGAIVIGQRDATMWVGRLESGSQHLLPDATFVHVFVARGTITLDGSHTLGAGDAARLAATNHTVVEATEDAEVVVWESAHSR